jgi:uroporphyrin-III C-methyltransferase
MGVVLVDLLTLRAAEVLRTADVIVHDRLVDPRILDLARSDAELIDVGKRPGTSSSQSLINDLLVSLGRSGRAVVRLKGGDPFVFGRGGEEILALREAGIDVAVVPGLSSALVAPLAAGIPVTHRNVARGILVMTGHTIDGDAGDFSRLAMSGVTLVILMGVEHRALIAEQLMGGGLPGSTPTAIVERACRDDQRVTSCSLDRLGMTPAVAPAVIVIGDVVTVLATDLSTLLVGATA